MSLQTTVKHQSETSATLSLGKITLAHFRNYDDLSLNFKPAPVVLTGANGSGKTNLLEAISLLVPGKGLRRAAILELQNRDDVQPWALAVELRTPYGPMNIGTG